VIAEKSAFWFRRDPAFDQEIRTRFASVREAAVAGELDAWSATSRGRLALIVLVDQFSRNLNRGDAGAFRHDALALAWARAALAAGDGDTLRPVERVFAYLPFEHSEVLADQDRSVALFTALRDGVSAELRPSFDGFLDYARRHRDIIVRFGRFPHRNAALGRASTPQESAFLALPGSSF
jgi:uncharacterized protein (DUF924 family)